MWPKPTQDHPETDRGYVVVQRSRKHILYNTYTNPGYSYPPIDVDYLVRVYFEDKVALQNQVLDRVSLQSACGASKSITVL